MWCVIAVVEACRLTLIQVSRRTQLLAAVCHQTIQQMAQSMSVSHGTSLALLLSIHSKHLTGAGIPLGRHPPGHLLA